MATTSNTYTGNGSNKLFSITFPYLDTTDIDVYLNGTLQTITTQYTFANATTIEFVAAPANGAVVLLKRSTDDATLQATFFPGSSIKAADLNLDFDQVLYIAQETANTATTATSTATSATTTANTALSQSSAAVSTANTASSNASAAVSTANTASTNASNAVTTANTASSNATTAVNTANAATSTANTASSNASAAVSTANTASSNASAAVSTANTASTNASAAVTTANAANSTANTASGNASTAVTTANNAVTTANTANSNSNTAVTTANAAAAAVANAVLYTTVANVAAIPGSPANNAAVEVTNSTGIQSFTPLSGLPAGFIGSSGLSVRIIYQTSGATWTWIQYFPNDPETRYLKLAGGTLTGALTLNADPSTNLQASTKQYVDTADALKVAKAGDTMTGALGVTAGTAAAPSLFISGSTNTGLYSPGSGQLAISTNGVARLTTSTTAVSSSLAIDVPLGAVGTPSITFTGDLNTGIYSPAADTIAFAEGGVEAMRIDSSGRLGLGTSSPGGLLEVKSADQNPNLYRLYNAYNAGASSWGVDFYRDTDSGNNLSVAEIKAVRTGGNASELKFGTSSTPGTVVERVRISSAGNVGIGTTSPVSALNIRKDSLGSGGTAESAITLTYSATNYGQHFMDSNGFYIIHADNNGVSGGNLKLWADANIIFNTAGTVADERARIDSSGRLLVGTSSGTGGREKLQVLGNANEATTGAGEITLARASFPADSDPIGKISFTGPSNQVFATIESVANGATGTNDHPGLLKFSTTADGAASPTERFRISSDGSFSSVIPGGSTLYPRFGCRAWVNFNGSGGGIRASGNVSSVTVNTTGNYTINFSTAMVDANFSVAGLCSVGGADGFLTILATATGSVQVRADEARGDFNPSITCVSIFR